MSRVGQSGEAYWWRVCYQWGLPRLVYQHAFNYKIKHVQLHIEIDKTPDPGHTRNITQIACSRLKVWHKYIFHVQNIGARPRIQKKNREQMRFKPLRLTSSF
jgi:hypothetical protein